MGTLLSAFHARLRQIVTAVAILVLASIGWLAVRVYREYGPLPVREAPAKVRLPFPPGVETVAFSPDGRRLVAGGRSGVTIWELSTGRVAWEWTQNPMSVRAVCYSPDGGRLAVLCQNGHLTLRDPDTGETRLICQPGEPDPPAAFIEPDTDTSTRSASSAAFSPDGRWLATGHYYSSYPHGVAGEMRVWETATGRRVRTLETPVGVKAVAYSQDGLFLATGDADGRLRLWDAVTGHHVRDLPPMGDGGGGVMFTRGGQEVVYSGGWRSEENPATVWDLKVGAARPLAGGRPSHSVLIRCMAVSANGRRLALGECVKDYRRGGERVRVWDLGSGDLIADYDCPAKVTALAYSPDGQELAAGCGGEVRVWDAP